jgi:dipeptidyl aminopeptidase/acylaminoacyl peptidase
MNVKTDSIMQDYYPDLDKSDGKIINNLMYRHWDSWSDGTHSHIFYATDSSGKIGAPVDIMKGENFDCPQVPDGGPEDVIWSPDGKKIVYVCKRKSGVAYAVSTNTDILVYDLSTGTTMNFTVGMDGYDTQPQFSQDASQFAWCSMAEDGYEADKNDIIVYNFSDKQKYNLTKDWDGTVNSFSWGRGDKAIFFIATYNGTDQIFKMKMPDDLSQFSYENIVQLTHGQFDINDIDGQSGMNLIVTRTDMNHASEIFSVDMQTGDMEQLSHVNDSMYNSIHMGKVQARWIRTSDGEKELTWFIYPPDFDSTKVYPTLLYCQGGPESALSQFYSFRWNFQLMASYGYIIVAPCRRGMPGFGVKWNSEIAGDYGGQAIKDYLSAIDSAAHLSYVDRTRLGCVGASYGGYSVFMLEGLHNGRFKTFIAHDGTFDNTSFYGTTEEMWFPNKDFGGPYWQTPQPKAYTDFNPITYADKWNTPMLIIHSELDFRNTVTQGFEAFNVLQLKGIKSRFLYFPSEGHWVLKPQDAILWQRTFFEWLHETL